MGWGFTGCVRVEHRPTGYVVRVDYDWHKSQYRCRQACLRILRGMMYAKHYGPQQVVRSYEIPDGETTIPVLETGACIGKR